MIWAALAVIVALVAGFGFGFYLGIVATGAEIGRRAHDRGLDREVVKLLAQLE